MKYESNTIRTVDLSIVIVNWNTREFLLSCLRSIYQVDQGISFEVIVSDNGSIDGSEEAVQVEFPEVIIIQNGRNLGFGSGANVGAAQAKGRYIALVPQDGTIPENTLKSMMIYLESNPKTGVVGCRLIGADGNTQISCARFPTPLRIYSLFTRLDRILPLPYVQIYYDRFSWKRLSTIPWNHLESRNVDTVLGAVFMMPIDVYRLVDGFDERYFMYYEEVDLFKKVHSIGYRIHFLSNVFAVHYGGEATKQEYASMRFEQQRSLLIYIKKWHGKLAAKSIQLFLIIFAFARLVVATVFSLFVSSDNKQNKQFKSAASSIFWGLLGDDLYSRYEKIGNIYSETKLIRNKRFGE